MRRPARSLAAALVASAVGAAAALAPPAAQALPVFSLSEVHAEAVLLDHSTVPCTRVANASVPMMEVPVVENGAATLASSSVSGSLTRDADPSDVLSLAADFAATSSVASLGGNPRTLRLTGSGSVAVSTTKSASLCNAEVQSRAAMRHAFTVGQGGFLTLTTAASPGTLTFVNVESGVDGERFVTLVSQGSKFEGPIRVFLPPGSYRGTFIAGAWASTSVAVGPTAVSASIRGDFTVAGSQLAVHPGKAKKYVVLPSARTCAAHTVLPTVTGTRKRLRQVKQVTFFVNGVRVEKVRHPHRGAQIALPAVDDLRADLRIEVALRPTRKGRPGKVLESTAVYEACS
jgi:hypothetical protein